MKSPVNCLLPPALSVEQAGLAENDSFEFIGRHMVANYVGCDPAALRDLDGLEAAMERAVEASGATFVKSARHVFPPHGYTLVILLSESHASIHTYPEHNSCFLDLFTCGLACQAERFDAVMRAYLRPAQVEVNTLIRHSGFDRDE